VGQPQAQGHARPWLRGGLHDGSEPQPVALRVRHGGGLDRDVQFRRCFNPEARGKRASEMFDEEDATSDLDIISHWGVPHRVLSRCSATTVKSVVITRTSATYVTLRSARPKPRGSPHRSKRRCARSRRGRRRRGGSGVSGRTPPPPRHIATFNTTPATLPPRLGRRRRGS
jgi:hypothetical protein